MARTSATIGAVLYYLAENLGAAGGRVRRADLRDDGFAKCRRRAARVDATIGDSFLRAWADKYDGAVHQTPIRGYPRHERARRR